MRVKVLLIQHVKKCNCVIFMVMFNSFAKQDTPTIFPRIYVIHIVRQFLEMF